MEKRNKRLAVVFGLLLLVNLSFFLVDDQSASLSFEEDLFVLGDTSGIMSVTVKSPEHEIALQRSSEGWILNEEYISDEGLMRLLFSLLQRVQVKKPVTIDVPDDAPLVEFGGEDPLSFYAWGNATKTKTYFSLKGREGVYEVGIPGYNEYLGQIFELNSDQWRDRLVFNGSWRTIQELTLDYQLSDADGFTIRFDDSFFKIEGVNQIDSAAVVDYLNQFQYFEVNEWISEGRFDRYDSLSLKPPLATLTIFTINLDEPVVFDIYPGLKNEPIHLVSDQNNNLMVIDRARVLGILRKRNDFSVED